MFEELKPCPFCGGKAKLHARSNKGYDGGVIIEYDISCRNCRIKLPNYYEVRLRLDEKGELEIFHDDREKSIIEWNRRAAVNEKEIGGQTDMAKWATGTPPQKCGRYLVTYKFAFGMQVRIADRTEYPRGNWYWHFPDGCRSLLDSEITAWQKCPEPYRDGGE